MELRLCMLISGGGTTAESIWLACQNQKLKGVLPVCLIASSDKAGGLQRLLNVGFPKKDLIVVNPKTFSSTTEFGQAIIEECEKRSVNFIGQYGWSCWTPENIIQKFKQYMINQHPGPLDPGRPDFGGKGMYGKRVLAARICFVRKTNRDFWTEATAQRVAQEYDQGAVIKRTKVPILPEDSVDSLHIKLLPVEHEVQIEALRDFANDQVTELNRDTSLVKPEEKIILENCKQEAIKFYPKG